MSSFRDRTKDFKDCVRKSAVSIGYDEARVRVLVHLKSRSVEAICYKRSKVALTMAYFIIHKPKERSPFTRAPFKTLDSIKEFEQFILKHRKDYVYQNMFLVK